MAMDTLRGSFGSYDAHDAVAYDVDTYVEPETFDHDSEEDGHDSPPPAIGTDERRMQVRAYNFWASLIEDRNFPDIEELAPETLTDFGSHSVLLDFSSGIEDPGIAYVGPALARECETNADGLPRRLSDVPPRSLLSRITDHYMQILANQSPIGFEAEFVNAAGATILYRGILLPFSSDDIEIDYIFGVINWKEMADSQTADELLLEIDQALEDDETLVLADEDVGEPADRYAAMGLHARLRTSRQMTDWADGPGRAANDGTDGQASMGERELPRPSFGLLNGKPIEDAAPLPTAESYEDAPLPSAGEEPYEEAQPTGMQLADWLAAARETALEMQSCEDRTRAALYAAVGRAWDFALAAADAPQDFAELLADAGIAAQERAPMTPVAKLVFGADYDKTRLTEYAAVLSWAQRKGLGQGALGDLLAGYDGGLKAVVAEERAFRRGDAPAPVAKRRAPRKSIARQLRTIAPRRLDAIETAGEEFALVMIRRTEAGEVVVLGEVSDDVALVEKAARNILA